MCGIVKCGTYCWGTCFAATEEASVTHILNVVHSIGVSAG